MPTDAFLKIEGIDGECTDEAHKKWIEILSYSHGLSQPVSAASSSGGRTGGRVSMSDFAVMKVMDSSSPNLALACCDGRHLTKVTVELCEATGSKHKYMEYIMENVIISSLQPSGSSGGDKPLESMTFNFGKISWTYYPAGNDGKPAGDKVGPTVWSLETNVNK